MERWKESDAVLVVMTGGKKERNGGENGTRDMSIMNGEKRHMEG